MIDIDVGINTKTFDAGVKLASMNAEKTFAKVMNQDLKLDAGDFIKEAKKSETYIDDIDEALAGLQNSNSVKGLANDFDLLNDNAGRSINEQKKALAQLIITGKKGSAEYDELNKQLQESIVLSKKLDSAMEDIEASVNKSGKAIDDGFGGGKFDKIGGSMAVAGAGILAVGAALGSIVETAGESQQAMNNLGAITGKTGEELEALKARAKDLYVGGFGESLPDAIKTTGILEQQLGKLLDPAVADKFAIGLQGAAKALDIDLTDGIQRSRSAIQNFGLTSEKELNSFLGLLQKTQNAESDVLDTLNEYAVDIADAGFSFERFGTALEVGIAGGLRNTDKLADSMREFNIAITDVDYETRFKGLGEGASEAEKELTKYIKGILTQANKGEIGVDEAFAKIGESASKALDAGELSQAYAKTLRNAIGGTPSEEIGAELFFNIAKATGDQKVLNEFANSGEKAAEQFAKAAEPQGFEGIKRQFNLLLDDVANSVMPALQPVIDMLPELMNLVKPLIQEIGKFVGDLISTLFPIVNVVFDIIKPLLPLINNLLSSVQKLLKPFLELISKVLQPLTRIIEPIVEIVDALVTALIDALLPVIEKLVTQIGDYLVNNIDMLVKGVEVMAKMILWAVNNVFIPWINVIGKVYSALVDFVGFIINSVTGTIKDLAESVMSVVNSIGEFFGLIEKKPKTAPFAKVGEDANKAGKEIKNLGFDLKAFMASYEKSLAGLTDTKQIIKAQKVALAELEKAGQKNSDIYRQIYKDMQKNITSLNTNMIKGAKGVSDAYIGALDKLNEYISKSNETVLKLNNDTLKLAQDLAVKRLEIERDRLNKTNELEKERVKANAETNIKLLEQEKERLESLPEDERLDREREINSELLKIKKNLDFELLALEDERLKKETSLNYDIIKIKAAIAKTDIENQKNSAIEAVQARSEVLAKELEDTIKNKEKLADALKKLEIETQEEILAIGQLYNQKSLLAKEEIQNQLAEIKPEPITIELEAKVNQDSFDEAGEKVKELSEKQKEYAEKGIDFVNELFEEFSNIQGETAEQNQDKQRESLKNNEISYAEYVDNVIAFEEKRVDYFEVAQKKLNAALLEEGKKYLQEKLATWIAEIFGESLGEFGPVAGAILAGVAVGTLTALVSGAETGVIGIDDNYKKAPGKTDTIPLMVAKGESIITEKGTKLNTDVLKMANSGVDVRQQLIKEYEANQRIDNKTINKISNSNVLNNISNPSNSNVLNNISNPSNSNVLNNISNPSNSNALNNISKTNNSNALNNISKISNSNVLNNISKTSNSDILNNISKTSNSDILNNISKTSNSNALNNISKTSNSTDVFNKINRNSSIENIRNTINNELGNINVKPVAPNVNITQRVTNNNDIINTLTDIYSENIKLRKALADVSINVNNYRNYSVNENKIVRQELKNYR